MTYYYLAADGSTAGPETLAVLTGMAAAGTISLATLVVPAGGEDWTPLARVLRFFYSDETGATAGPVAFSELQRLNQTGVLGGDAWVLDEGAEQWKALSQVLAAGGAEVYVPATPDVQAAPRAVAGVYRPPGGRTQGVAADPYAPPRAQGGGQRVVVRRRHTGGMNRLQYFLYAVLLQVVLAGLLLGMIAGRAFFAGPMTFEQLDTFLKESMVAVNSVMLLVGVLSIVFAIQRLKNIGWPWYFLFLGLIPIVGIWLNLALLAYPPGYAYHKRFDGPAKAILAVWIFLLVAGVATVIMVLKKHRGRLYTTEAGAGQITTITRLIS